MKINCGIIGLPNIGKSTLFNLLTNISVKIDNFPFCTIKPNVATIQIPDARLYQLNSVVKTREIIHGTVEFIDIAGLIKGASQGLGLGNQILYCIQTTQILCHMIRCFDNNTIFHTEKDVNPKRDIHIINTELILFDILQCEKNIIFLKKNYKITDNDIDQKLFILEKCLIYLNKEIMLRTIQFSKIESKYIQEFNFLTFKPVIYIANVNENYINNNYFKTLNKLGFQEKIPVVPMQAIISNSELKLKKQQYILNLIIRHILSLLQLQTFFTVNINMIKAWVYITGATALEVSSYIHSDFKRGFIRVQIVKFDEFIKYQGIVGSKKFGKVFYGGKNYLVEEGDILQFLFKI